MDFKQFLLTLDYGVLIAVLSVLLMTMSIMSAGLGIIELCRVKFRRSAYCLGGAIAPGLAFISLLSLFLGTVLKYESTSICVVLIIIAVAGALRYHRTFFGAITGSFKYNLWPTVFIIVIMIYFFGSAMLYPGAWDEMTYQVTVPLRWSQTGNAAVYPDLPYSGFPGAPQLINTMLISIGGILAPRIMQWMIYFILYWSISHLIRRAGKFASLVLLAAFVLSPVNTVMLKDVYAEPWMLLSLTSAAMLIKARRSSSLNGIFLLLGICGGFAVAAKLTGAAIGFVILTLGYFRLKDRTVKMLLPVMFFCSAGALFGMMFYLRPWLLAGNPLYPYFGWIFGDKAAAETALYHHAMGSAKFGLRNFWGFFTSPILVAYHGGPMFDGIVFGLQFLALLVCAVVFAVKRVRRTYRFGYELIISSVAFYLFWFITSPQSRFLLPLFILFLLIASGMLASSTSRINRLVTVIILLLTLYSVWEYRGPFLHYKTAWKIVRDGRQRLAAWYLGLITRDPGYVKAMETLCRKTPQDAKVMLLFERRGLYVPREYYIGTPYFQSRFFTPVPEDEKDVFRLLHGNNISFILTGPSLHNPDHLSEYNDKNRMFMQLILRLLRAKKLHLIWSYEGEENDVYNLLYVDPEK